MSAETVEKIVVAWLDSIAPDQPGTDPAVKAYKRGDTLNQNQSQLRQGDYVAVAVSAVADSTLRTLGGGRSILMGVEIEIVATDRAAITVVDGVLSDEVDGHAQPAALTGEDGEGLPAIVRAMFGSGSTLCDGRQRGHFAREAL